MAELRGAGIVDDLDFLHPRQLHGDGLGGCIRREQHEVGIEAGLLEHLPRDLHRHSRRQDSRRMRLDDDAVARRQRREQAGIGVPGREGGAADNEGDAARDDFPALVELDRIALALRLLPAGGLRNAALLRHGVGDSLQGAILRMRAAGLEGHHEGLARGHRDRVGDEEGVPVQPLDDLQQHAGADLGGGILPAIACVDRGLHQRAWLGGRIGDAELRAEGRDLVAYSRLVGGMAVQQEGLAE
jgi:hypothetical protein